MGMVLPQTAEATVQVQGYWMRLHRWKICPHIAADET